MATFTLNVRNVTGGPINVVVAVQPAGGDSIVTRWPGVTAWTTSPSIDIDFDPDAGQGLVGWYVEVEVAAGQASGVYESRGSWMQPRTIGGLLLDDDGTTVTLSVALNQFRGTFAGGEVSASMRRTGPYCPKIRNVFVLMLENRSFDQLLGGPRNFGTDAVSGQPAQTEGPPNGATNSYTNAAGAPVTITVTNPTPAAMTLSGDPGHEFPDVLEQLGGHGAALGGQGQYPANLPLSGFARNYANVLLSKGVSDTSQTVGQIMSVVMPAANGDSLCLQQLMLNFAVCDHWFASMPGPTWPNRFFAVAGTSGGLDVSPTPAQLAASEYLRGFTLGNGPIFTKLKTLGLSYRIYKDYDNDYAQSPSGLKGLGWQTIAAGITGMHRREVARFRTFADDLKDNYPHAFTFIEPHYGNTLNGTYLGGSSQHPMDGLLGGEALIKATYEAIRNSPRWEHSLLIITYDETGGTWDHVAPPTTVAPDALRTYNRAGFDFKALGPRVPAVIVSPWVTKGMIDKRIYDHTSIIATTLGLFNGGTMTARDAAARNLIDLLRQPGPRQDCPTQLQLYTPLAARDAPDPTPVGPRDTDPLDGTMPGFVLLAAKTDFEMSDGSDQSAAVILGRLGRIQTYGAATDYITDVFNRADDLSGVEDLTEAVLTGEATSDQRATAAALLGMKVDEMDRLRARALAAGVLRLKTTRKPAQADWLRIRDQIGAFEYAGSEVGDDDDDGFTIAPGTSATLRYWS